MGARAGEPHHAPREGIPLRYKYKQVIEALERALAFLGWNPVPPPASYGEPKVLLERVVARLREHAADQVAGVRLARAERKRQKELRKVLRELHLRPISLIAQASLRSAAGIEKALRMPAPQLPVTKLLSEADAMRKAASLYEPVFVKCGRPKDFLAQLDRAMGDLRKAFLGTAAQQGTRAGASAGIVQELKEGRSAIQMLDAIVSTSFAGNPDVLTRWRIAKRIRGLPSGGVEPALPEIPATGGTADENAAPQAA